MKFLLALGANLPSKWGNSAETLSHALGDLSERICPLLAKSSLYATPAYPAGSGPEFVNAVVMLECDLLPEAMLKICNSIEGEAEREREIRWGPRTLDIDIVAADEIVVPNMETFTFWNTLPKGEQIRHTPDRLILPHPRLQDRVFVLVPMMDIVPDWRHPVSGLTTAQMLAAVPAADKAAIRRIGSL